MMEEVNEIIKYLEQINNLQSSLINNLQSSLRIREEECQECLKVLVSKYGDSIIKDIEDFGKSISMVNLAKFTINSLEESFVKKYGDKKD